jgi:hypothetical protein
LPNFIKANATIWKGKREEPKESTKVLKRDNICKLKCMNKGCRRNTYALNPFIFVLLVSTFGYEGITTEWVGMQETFRCPM